MNPQFPNQGIRKDWENLFHRVDSNENDSKVDLRPISSDEEAQFQQMQQAQVQAQQMQQQAQAQQMQQQAQAQQMQQQAQAQTQPQVKVEQIEQIQQQLEQLKIQAQAQQASVQQQNRTFQEKLPSSYPIPLEHGPGGESQNPYTLLGVTPETPIEDINAVYKKLLIVLHPDKGITEDAQRLGWTVEEKNKAFRQIRNAYKVILKTRKEMDFPDYNLDYFVNEEFSQQYGLDRLNMTKQDTSPDNFSLNKFNQNFGTEQQYHEKQGFADPFAQGYKEFGGNKVFSDSGPTLKMPARPDIEAYTPTEFAKPEMVDGRIAKYIPKDIESVGIQASHGVGFAELGLTTVDDFSMSMSCKGGICGSDLMSVYGTNNENWEDSVARDKELYNKYNDTTAPERKMSKLRSSRKTFDFKDVDPTIQRQIDEEERQNKRMQAMRQSYIQDQDRYYDEFAQRTIMQQPNNFQR
jgi:hypothetical protein